MRRTTSYHLYEDCSRLVAWEKNSRSSIKSHDTFEFGDTEFVLKLLTNLCKQCYIKAVLDEGKIDDFNSVWFGLGPDFNTAPLLAGVG